MSDISVRDRYTRRIVREKLANEINAHVAAGRHHLPGTHKDEPINIRRDKPWRFDDLPPAPKSWQDHKPRPVKDPLQKNVCIVGAGAAGLYLGMIFDFVNANPQDFNVQINYDILEANSIVGGRAFTHKFEGIQPDAKHLYYDCGAMRFPQIKTMDRVFKLFDKTGVTQIKYIYSPDADHPTPQLFNDILVSGSPPGDPFQFSTANGGPVPAKSISAGAESVIEQIFGPFKDKLKVDFDVGFEYLVGNKAKGIAGFDDFSTRQYIAKNGTPYNDFDTTQWLETVDNSTGLYDKAFTESVIDSFDFDYDSTNQQDPDWFCIEGGTSEVTDAMQGMIKNPAKLSAPVSKIAYDQTTGSMEVTYTDPTTKAPQTNAYDAVFTTTTLGCLQRMDLTQAQLSCDQKIAIRSLSYDNSCKVAMVFNNPWWITQCNIQGGSAVTDMPLRTCVYPSYNLDDGASSPAVLLCSYTWAQDAQRIGSLISPNSPVGEDELKQLILSELGRLHPQVGTDVITSAYKTHHSWDWSHNPYTSGAFALFGPGQFYNLYPELNIPAADSKLFIVGEACSAHHAWIVGALDSAHASAFKWLKSVGEHHVAHKIADEWGLPDEVEDGEKGTLHLQIALGKLKPNERIHAKDQAC